MIVDELQDVLGYVSSMRGDGDWPGGVLMLSVDGGQTYTAKTSFTESGTIGIAQSVIGAHDGYVLDRYSELAITVASGTFDSISEQQMMTGKNWCAYGAPGRWEIIRYSNAVAGAENLVTLSGFVRGARGTEWATGLHLVGDFLVFLDDPDNQFIGDSAISVGVARQFKAVTFGQSSVDSAKDFTYRAVNLTPLSVVNVSGLRDVGQDIVISWFTRTRYSSSFWITGMQPANEQSMRFEIDVMDGSSVVRTLVSSSLFAVYSALDQVADFGTVQSSVNIIIYQISPAVGRGYPRSAVV